VAAVRRAPIELSPATPWSLRLFDRIPLPAFWAGLAVGAGIFALFLLYTAALGDGPGRLPGLSFEWGWLAEAIQDGLAGFAVAVTAASLRAAREEVEAVRPALSGGRPSDDLAREVLHYPRGLLLAVGACGALSSFPTVLSPGMWAEGRPPGWWHPTVAWLFVRNAVTWWLLLRGMALELLTGHRFSRLARFVEVADPCEREVFRPFARRALRNVLLWMLLAAWLALTYVGPGWAIGTLMALGLTTVAAFACASFVLPLLGPHARLRAAKDAELVRARAALRVARDAALGPARAGAPGRLADLVAYERRVADAGEWPIESSTLLRFGLYLALGLGSWVGAGLVQHLLERALR
jgi:hypothetical protein